MKGRGFHAQASADRAGRRSGWRSVHHRRRRQPGRRAGRVQRRRDAHRSPTGQPQAAAWTASGATAHTYGTHGGPQQAAPQLAAPQQPAGPQAGPQVSPQLNPQLNPQLSPQVARLLPQSGPQDQNNLFRPYQECSPQSLLDANVPIGLLATPETHGFSCTQNNTQANAFATAR
ncbi:hypothetical protein O1L55_31065 [Streptomyces albulus]|nr:hypothetical protein [Streptomyces noursei]